MSHYYVSGCVADGDDVSTCDDSVAQFWTLYHRNDEGLSEGIIDCIFREDAEAAMRVYEQSDALREQFNFKANLTEQIVELKAQRDALAAENAALKKSLITIANSERFDGDSFVCDFDSLVSVAAGALSTPATDAYLNSVRSEGAEAVEQKLLRMCAVAHRSDKEVIHALSLKASEIAAQLRAGKDGE